GANDANRRTDTSARAQTQRRFGMLDGSLGLPGKQAEQTAVVPAAGKARIERQSPIHQRHHRADVLAENRKRVGSIHDSSSISPGHSHGPLGKIGTLPTICLSSVATASDPTCRMKVCC